MPWKDGDNIMKKSKILKVIFTFVTVILLVLSPCTRSYAIDADHVKVAVDEVGKCYNTTFETFNFIAFVLKHPEIGYPDKETVWAYYEMYCKPNGELAPCTLEAYMDYTQFDIDYFLSANGLSSLEGETDSRIFDYYCNGNILYGWKARGLTEHANALIQAYNYWCRYYLWDNELVTIVNFYAVPSTVMEYYTIDPYSDPTTWNIITSVDGPMLYGLGNCQAYAKLYMMLLDFSGIPSRTVISNTHMWNEVLYNGIWYNCDTCWADITQSHVKADLSWCMVLF